MPTYDEQDQLRRRLTDAEEYLDNLEKKLRGIEDERELARRRSLYQLYNQGPESRAVSFYLHGALLVETNAMSFVAPMGLTIQEVRLSVDTAPTGADLIVDVNLNGVTVFTVQANRPRIAAGGVTGLSPAPVVVAVPTGGKITLDVDQIGTTVAGSNLAVTILCII